MTCFSARAPHRCLSASRARLCGEMRFMQSEREDLRAVTMQQRNTLKDLEGKVDALRKDVMQADVARAGLACESCASRCAADVAQLELRQLVAEHARLEHELSSWRHNAARYQNDCEITARREAERSCWEEDRRRLERDILAAREELLGVEENAGRQATEVANMQWQQSTAAALREEALQQRALREEAERQLRATQSELVGLRERCQGITARREADRPGLLDLRASLASQTEERQRSVGNVESGLVSLDAMRRELQEVTADNAQLRIAVQRSLRGLESIERQSAEAEALMSSFPRPSLA